MLLPSAISCDTSQPPRLLQSALFISPPASPPQLLSGQTAIGNLINSCRNLHNLIGSPVGPAPPGAANPQQLPSPPLVSMPSPAFSRPRLRRRKAGDITTTTSLLRADSSPRCRVKRRMVGATTTPPRGVNKRRRDLDDDMDRNDEEMCARQEKENINIFETGGGGGAKKEDGGVFVFRGCTEASSQAAPSTPKRRRIAPPIMPRGLTREDFHKLGPSEPAEEEGIAEGTDAEVNSQGDSWSTEDDQLLVEVVLEKVKNMDLSSEVWDDCVRNLPGKDHDSVSSRWENLLRTDSIGLQQDRGKLHGMW